MCCSCEFHDQIIFGVLWVNKILCYIQRFWVCQLDMKSIVYVCCCYLSQFDLWSIQWFGCFLMSKGDEYLSRCLWILSNILEKVLCVQSVLVLVLCWLLRDVENISTICLRVWHCLLVWLWICLHVECWFLLGKWIC